MPKNRFAGVLRLPQINGQISYVNNTSDFINFTLDCSANTINSPIEEPELSLFIDCFDVFGEACPTCGRIWK